MQGDIDQCVFSTLASVFHHMDIPDLVMVARILQDKSNHVSGGRDCLKDTKQNVENTNIKWLQLKRMPKTFQ
jgi:hypothetical protein